jgi:hypothetical protein
MTAELDNHPPREPFTAHEPARRSGSIVLADRTVDDPVTGRRADYLGARR